MSFAPDQRIPVRVLGATGAVGQRFVSLLADHPWFELRAVAASERSAGKRYGDAVRWALPGSPPSAIADLVVETVAAPSPEMLVFSALGSDIAGDIESAHARAGALVVTNASSHRMDADVPLIVPEVNPDHLGMLSKGGGILANPNCSTIGLVLALAPLHCAFVVEKLHVVTMQALSGAGMVGVGADLAMDNVVPYIPSEEEKLALEPAKILGSLVGSLIEPADITVSAQCNRVAVSDGHTECVSLSLGRDVTADEIREAWSSFRGLPQELGLPSAPVHPILVHDALDAPQPVLHRDLEGGMACSVGRLAPCPVLGWRFTCLSHNTLRGAAGGALLAAELAVARGLVS